ncbi:MAG: hypothetical protein HC904_10925 [Blastochloris sp.]|nr:hypothetical protein [Blastochloris sp.]
MKPVLNILVFSAILPLLITKTFASQKISKYYECQVEPKADENFAYAAAQCWVPPNGKINGIMCVVLHSAESSGMTLKNPEPWINLVMDSNWALMSISFSEASNNKKPWFLARHGTGRALLASCAMLAKLTDHQEMSVAPIILAGVCSAGQFSYEFAAFSPERTQAFVTIGGGQHDESLVQQNAKINGLLIVCSDRSPKKIKNLLDIFLMGTQHQAQWALSVEKISTYDSGFSSKLVADYLYSNMKTFGIRHDVKKFPNNTVLEIGNISNIWKLALPNLSYDFNSLQKGRCHFPDQKTANIWRTETSVNDLSFPGAPISIPLTVTPNFSDVGIINRNKNGGAKVHASLTVTSSNENIDLVTLDTFLSEKTSITVLEKQRWKIDSIIEIDSFPSGTFQINLPVRYAIKNKPLLGGVSASITGKIVGNVKSDSYSVDFGQIVHGHSKIKKIRLQSPSGIPIKFVSISNTLGEWADCYINQIQSATSAEIDFKLMPPNTLRGKYISGYYNIRVRTNYEETIKVHVYASVIESN